MSVAARVAHELGVKLGHEVGYLHFSILLFYVSCWL